MNHLLTLVEPSSHGRHEMGFLEQSHKQQECEALTLPCGAKCKKVFLCTVWN